MKFLAGAVTGAIGSVCGNPFDVLKTLSQTNRGKSIPLSTLVGQMYHDQGIAGFYRGVQVNVMRAIVLNATNMGVYDISKGHVVDMTGWTRKDPRTAFCSSFIAGFWMTCTVAPFDFIRTKLMNQPTSQKLYNGMSDCLVQTVRQEGVLSLWRGFIPIWARFAPMATIQLLTLEFLYSTFGFKAI
jgi:Mitochondrial carrier protein